MPEQLYPAWDGLYRRLHVASDASREEIVRSYRRLAYDAHPDAHPDEPEASQRFRELTEAYEVLSDPRRRASYDRTRPAPRATSTGQAPATTAAPPVVIGLGPARVPRGCAFGVGPVHVTPEATRPGTGPAVYSDVVRLLDEVLSSVWWD